MSKEYKEEPRGDYDVGYAKPPLQSRFAKGHPYYPPHSRRPKKDLMVKSGRSIVADVVEKKMPVRLDGRRCRITRLKAAVMTDMQAALKGDCAALLRLTKRAKKLGYFDLPARKQQGGVVVIPRPRPAAKMQ